MHIHSKVKSKRSKVGGFTLIELLVVISIIGLLSSIILASLNSARVKARDSNRISTIHQIQNALELYRTDHAGNYPLTSTDGTNGTLNYNPVGLEASILDSNPTGLPAILSPYMSLTTTASTLFTGFKTWLGNQVEIQYISYNGQGYILLYKGESQITVNNGCRNLPGGDWIYCVGMNDTSNSVAPY